ncbi:MAG: hypothetical protein E7470_05915 [Ruminococcaceae bacterium]|nr:hypothetical protein [Oscillospiraceae bacterium]
MNVAFLLGNGFDLQLGMETGYKSFLKWYVEQPTNDSDIAQFRTYLKDQNSEWWSDAEIAMGQYLGNFSDDNIAVFFKNIRDFKLRLSEYLMQENEKYDLEKNSEVIDAFIDFLLKSSDDIMLRPTLLHLNELRKRNNTLIHFVTFNYTDALDRIVRKVKERSKTLETITTNSSVALSTKVGNIYHVHGSLNSSLIMGVDNHEQLNGSNISDFSKVSRTLIKPIVNDELGRDEHENAIAMLYDCRYLFFYGLSFGITDKTWWDLIKDRLIKDGNMQVVIFTRSPDDVIQTIIPEDILDYVNDKKDAFLKKLGIAPGSEHYDAVRKRVFVIRNTKRLNISIKDRNIPVNV